MSPRETGSEAFPLLGVPLAFAIVGFVLGFGVTLSAWLVDTWWQGVGFTIAGVWRVHGTNPLHIFTDVSPVAFATAAWLLGTERGRVAVLRGRLRTLAEARATDALWRRVVAASPDGVLIVGPDEVIRHANPAAERVFGRRASVLVGMRLPEVLQNAHRMRPDTAFDLRTGLGERLGVAWKLLARHGSGALVPVLVTSVPLGSGPDASRAVRVRDVSLEPKRAGQAGADST